MPLINSVLSYVCIVRYHIPLNARRLTRGSHLVAPSVDGKEAYEGPGDLVDIRLDPILHGSQLP